MASTPFQRSEAEPSEEERERLANLRAELARAKKELEEWSGKVKLWSDRVEEAILAGNESAKLEAERANAQKERDIAQSRVKDLEAQLALPSAPQGHKRVLAPIEDDESSMARCVKKAFPTLSGLVGSSLVPSRSLEDRVLELGTKLNGDHHNTEKVLFRSCYYSAIFDIMLPWIEKNEAILVGGAPGIGKSVLGMLLSIVLVHHRHKVVLYEHFGSRLLLAFSGCEKVALDSVISLLKKLRFNPDDFDVKNNNVFKVSDDELFKELRSKQDIVFIQDAGDSTTEIIPILGKPFVLITSPNTDRIKRASRERMFQRVFLPPWDLEELQVASQRCFDGKLSPAQVEKRFLQFGGIARSVLDVHGGLNEETAEKAYEKAVRGCSFESLSETFRSAYTDLRKGPISSMLVHAVPAPPIGPHGISSDSQNKFASPKTRERLMEMFLKSTTLKAAEFTLGVKDIPEMAEYVGRYLESNFHRSVSDGRFKVRSLSGARSPFTEVLFPLMIRVEFTREDFMDISSVHPDHYYQPSRPNFPTLDSFALLSAKLFFGAKARGYVLVIFQVTKSPKHTLNGQIVKRLQDRLIELKVQFTKTLFVWVSSEGGILQEQKVTNGEGAAYQRDAPKMEQWLLVFGQEYNELFAQVLKAGASNA